MEHNEAINIRVERSYETIKAIILDKIDNWKQSDTLTDLCYSVYKHYNTCIKTQNDGRTNQ